MENREQQRLAALNREMGQKRQQQDLEERNRKTLMEILENWDDDEKRDRGRELFFADRYVLSHLGTDTRRSRWRTQRQAARTREYQEDVRDRQLEEDELKDLERESEDFLKRQLAEMEELEIKQKEAGLLTEDAAPIRLAMNAAMVQEVKREAKPDPVAPAPRPGVMLDAGEEEEEDPNKKKKRTLVKLEYNGEEGDGLTDAERTARRNARLLEIRAQIPRDRKRLWSTTIEWAAINEVCNDFVRRLIDISPSSPASFAPSFRRNSTSSWARSTKTWLSSYSSTPVIRRDPTISLMGSNPSVIYTSGRQSADNPFRSLQKKLSR